jgi:hypothetical protein
LRTLQPILHPLAVGEHAIDVLAGEAELLVPGVLVTNVLKAL